jgi:hypothetical protein
MKSITEAEFERLVEGILDDRDPIIKHNPIGTDEEILLWMLMSVLVTYLSLEAIETPCFTGRPDASTYGNAIRSILATRRADNFDPDVYLDKLSK